ncbi:hypothetical protein Anas_04482 [Armadillidium nasatum]|uniref:NADH dehydrogenase [ubiquinone] 1 beta subcomplex subunit 4 n=1 Tax=Armadillidium nasatum TaxID=96803 RepID=A0A5N5TIX4_9CRUS|nr:hypothetical protein Anas_04482 [Armadillidium nasatum]
MATQSDREVMEFRRQMKEKLKKEFRRQYWDPFKHAAGDGHVFDPALQRYMSMRACQYDYFKATPRTTIAGLLSISPIFITYFFVRRERKKLEEDCGTGKIAYEDRKYKFMV